MRSKRSPPADRPRAGARALRPGQARRARGFTLIEVLVATAVGALLLTALSGVVGVAMDAREEANARNRLAADARFAMERMVRAVSRTNRLLLPLAENPGTAWSESVRDPGVLAVTLDHALDRDGDGWADANNDKDYQDLNGNATRDAGEPERIDEDLHGDNTNDDAAGLVGIDDDNDGAVDESEAADPLKDNDESGGHGDDSIDGLDEDGDGAVDEDIGADMSGDNQPGLAGVDDDGDGSVDEGISHDDDEDGAQAEDWLDVVAYFLSGSKLIERFPDLNPADGTDYSENAVADDVTAFRVERVAPGAGDRHVVVDLTLTLGSGNVATEIRTRVRVGGAL